MPLDDLELELPLFLDDLELEPPLPFPLDDLEPPLRLRRLELELEPPLPFPLVLWTICWSSSLPLPCFGRLGTLGRFGTFGRLTGFPLFTTQRSTHPTKGIQDGNDKPPNTLVSGEDLSLWERLVVKKKAADKALKDKKPPTEIGGPPNSSPNSDMSALSVEEIQSAAPGRSTEHIRDFMNPDANPSRSHGHAVMPGLPGLFTPGATVVDPEAFQTAMKAQVDASNQISSNYKSDRNADAELDDKKTHNRVHVLDSARKAKVCVADNQANNFKTMRDAEADNFKTMRDAEADNFKTMRDAEADLDTAKANGRGRTWTLRKPTIKSA